jgi:hypothetical protein
MRLAHLKIHFDISTAKNRRQLTKYTQTDGRYAYPRAVTIARIGSQSLSTDNGCHVSDS